MTLSIQLPGSKSVTHRAMVLAAASDQPCTIHGVLRADDTDTTLHALRTMGHQASVDQTTIRFRPSPARPVHASIDCGNSGTSLRLLTATAATHPWATRFDGDTSLRRRPMAPLFEAMDGHGARSNRDHAPFKITGPLRPGTYDVDGSTSSQFTSALLLALPRLDGHSALTVTGEVVSRPYSDMTLDVMRAFGVRVTREGTDRYAIPGGQVPRCDRFDVDPDWSTAAFYMVAGALTDGVHLPGLRTGTSQPDEAAVAILGSFGVQVDVEDDGVTVYPGPVVSPGTIDMRDHPDLFPILSILAACADGTTTFTGAEHLHHKESDRVHAMVEGLARMGISAKERPDGMVVPGGRLHGTSIHSYDDHRIHMAFEIASLVADGPCKVDGAKWASTSHPDFHEHMIQFRRAIR